MKRADLKPGMVVYWVRYRSIVEKFYDDPDECRWVFDGMYRYTLVPTSATAKAMNVASDGVTVQQWDMPSGVPGDTSKFAILPSGSDRKSVV